jgi:hypothetical protein
LEEGLQGFINEERYEVIVERGRGKVRLDSVGYFRIKKTRIGELNVYDLSITTGHPSTHTRD